MPNPRLSAEQLALANAMLDAIRDDLRHQSKGDENLLWALRRKITKELMHDERGKPGHRQKIKQLKREEQKNLCPLCGDELPETYCVLDRFEAVKGYTVENTRLIHQRCDRVVQSSKGYT